MTSQWEPVDRANTYELVVRQIKDEIFAGRLRPGDRLPGERQLSELLNVSRPTVREAVRILQAMGILRSHPGNGSNSGLVVSTRPSRALSELLGLHVALSSYSVPEIMDVRIALECRAVRQVAENPHSLSDELPKILERMTAPGLDREQYNDLDVEFHLTLAQAASNRFLADLMVAMRESVRRPMDLLHSDAEWHDRQIAVTKEHVEIYDAVRDGRPDHAEQLIRQHIEHVYQAVPTPDALLELADREL